MKDNIIEVRDITKSWGSFTALTSLSLDIHRGEILTLLGPSGSGKSTLMRIIAGFENPDRGVIMIDGQDVTHTPPEKRPVNMVFQRYALFPHLDVFDNVAFGPRLKKMKNTDVVREVDLALDLVQLSELRSRWISEISGGQAQRVALARALVNRPAVLLLDEPLAALDLKIRHQMLDELKRIHRETGTTFLFVTHDQDEAMILSDRVVLMNDGRIEQIATPDEMYGNPKTLFSARFFGETNLLNGKVIAADSESIVVDTTIGRLRAANKQFDTDEQVHLSVRPEAIRITEEADSPVGVNQALGLVETVDFIGSRIVYKVRHQPTGKLLKCQESRSSAGLRFPEGSAVVLNWDMESVVALAE